MSISLTSAEDLIVGEIESAEDSTKLWKSSTGGRRRRQEGGGG